MSGTNWSRNSSVTACSEIASIEPISAPARAISGTTPEVDSVMRRLEMLNPVAVGDNAEPVAHRLEIVERLAHAHHHDVRDQALFLLGAGGRRRALPIVEPIAREHHLAGDLRRRQIAHEALRAGVAESCK